MVFYFAFLAWNLLQLGPIEIPELGRYFETNITTEVVTGWGFFEQHWNQLHLATDDDLFTQRIGQIVDGHWGRLTTIFWDERGRQLPRGNFIWPFEPAVAD